MSFSGPMNIVGALLLVLLVAALVGLDFWSNRALRKLGVEPTKGVRGLRLVNFIALAAVLAYALYVVFTR